MSNPKSKVTMTPKELRELDAWIHKHVFEGYLYVGLKKHGYWYRPNAQGYTDSQKEAGRYTRAEAKKHEYPHDEPVTIHEFAPEHYTTDPAAAMEVLKGCAKKVGSCESLRIRWGDGQWEVREIGFDSSLTQAETLELAICLFAKNLFTK